MKTFDKLKSSLEKRGVKLIDGPVSDVVNSACSSIDDVKKVAEDLFTEIGSSFESSEPDGLLFKLKRFYSEKNPDGSPVRTLFPKGVYPEYKAAFHKWWLVNTGESIANFPKTPEFYVYHHSKDKVHVVIGEFLRDYPEILNKLEKRL